MQLSDPEVIGGFLGVIGALATVTKLYHTQLKKQIADDKKEFEERIEKQEYHIKECDDDRKELHNKQNKNIAELAELKAILGIASTCERGDCPRKEILRNSQRHVIRPSSTS